MCYRVGSVIPYSENGDGLTLKNGQDYLMLEMTLIEDRPP